MPQLDDWSPNVGIFQGEKKNICFQSQRSMKNLINMSLSTQWTRQNNCGAQDTYMVTKREAYHVLHANADLPITVECSIKAHDIGRITLM